MNEYPDFVIVCEHGIRGGDVDPVGRYRWDDPQWIWVPVGDAIKATYLEGHRPGWWHPDKADDEPSRVHHEIICPKAAAGCRRRYYRTDDDKIQTLLAVIAGNKKFRDVFAASATDTEVTITLFALHAARDTARTRFRMNV